MVVLKPVRRANVARPRFKHSARKIADPEAAPRRRKATTERAPSKLDSKTVLIDYRRGSKELLKYPPFDCCGHEADLLSGDISFMGWGPSGQVRVGVELKSVTDLVGSIDNGRIVGTQIPRMMDQYDAIWLIYYGVFQPAPDKDEIQLPRKGRWKTHYLGKRAASYKGLMGAVIELQEAGIGVARVNSMREAALFLEELVFWRSKRWSEHKLFRAFDRAKVASLVSRKRVNRTTLAPRIDDRTKLRATTAIAWPALGYERALVAAKQWSVEEMVEATSEQWAELETKDRETGKTKRLGPVAGKAVYDAIRW